MKHFFRIWIGLALLFSCSREQPDDEQASAPLRFEAGEAVWRASFRSDYTGNTGENPIPDMVVYGYYTGTDDWVYTSDTAQPGLMDSVVVANNGGVWSYAPPRYFFPTGNHSFFAFAPHSAITADVRNSVAVPGGAPVLAYHLPENVSGHKDLLFGWKTDVTNEQGSPVVIGFHHITTRVTFSARVDPDYTVPAGTTVRITSIVFSGIYSGARTNVSYSAEGTPEVIWENPHTPAEVSLTIVNGSLNDQDLTELDEMSLISQRNSYMIPQSVPPGAALTIAVEETVGSQTRIKMQTFDLAILNTLWRPGQAIDYQLTYNGFGDTPISVNFVDPGTGDPGDLTPIGGN